MTQELGVQYSSTFASFPACLDLLVESVCTMMGMRLQNGGRKKKVWDQVLL